MIVFTDSVYMYQYPQDLHFFYNRDVLHMSIVPTLFSR